VKVAVVVGTRPEVIKMAPVLRALRERGAPGLLVHTGQHYSAELAARLFRELELPDPDLNLGVGSGSGARQLGRVLRRIEPVLRRERPDVVLVEGDTNSVLAAALAAQTLGLRIGHVEAGLRSGDRTMPEETNRILTDHLATDLFAPTDAARRNLCREGIDRARIHVTGNTVVDELLRQLPLARAEGAPARFGVERGGYALATMHRPASVERLGTLRDLLAGLARAGRALRRPVLMSLHPRTARRIAQAGLRPRGPVRLMPALGYRAFLGLLEGAALVLTDSGGLQEEACALRVPCVTLRDSTERPESVEVGANALAGSDPSRIVARAREMVARPRTWPNPYGDGRAGARIVDLLLGAVLRSPARGA